MQAMYAPIGRGERRLPPVRTSDDYTRTLSIYRRSPRNCQANRGAAASVYRADHPGTKAPRLATNLVGDLRKPIPLAPPTAVTRMHLVCTSLYRL